MPPISVYLPAKGRSEHIASCPTYRIFGAVLFRTAERRFQEVSGSAFFHSRSTAGSPERAEFLQPPFPRLHAPDQGTYFADRSRTVQDMACPLTYHTFHLWEGNNYSEAQRCGPLLLIRQYLASGLSLGYPLGSASAYLANRAGHFARLLTSSRDQTWSDTPDSIAGLILSVL